MCNKRTLSSGGILDNSFGNNLLPEVAAQLMWSTQVDFPSAHQSRKLCLHSRQSDQARLHASIELDQQINIAICVCRSFGVRTEQSQPSDMVLATIVRKFCGKKGLGRIHDGIDDKCFHRGREDTDS